MKVLISKEMKELLLNELKGAKEELEIKKDDEGIEDDEDSDELVETFEYGYYRAIEALLNMTTDNPEEKEKDIEKLKAQIDYLKRKMEICAYGKRELAELDELEDELARCTTSIEYAVEVVEDESRKFIRQIDVFDSIKECEKCIENGRKELQNGECYNIIISYD